MKSATRPLLISAIAMAILVAALVWNGDPEPRSGSLLFYCAASFKAPVDAIARAYEAEHGVRIALQYGGSGTLLSSLKASGRGDLYLAADSSYTDLAQASGHLIESVPLATLHPVLAVAEGNPLHIQGIADLLREDVRAALANPEAASVGKTTKSMLVKHGEWAAVESAVRARGVFKPTVIEVANDVKLGTVDAGIIWDATAVLYPALDVVHLPEAAGVEKHVVVGVLRSAADRAAALHFMRYLAAEDKGLRTLEEYGFHALDADAHGAAFPLNSSSTDGTTGKVP